MSLATPVGSSFATRALPPNPILFSQKPRPASAKPVPGSASPFSTCCQGPRTLQVGKASSPGLLDAREGSCSFQCWAPTPQLSPVLLVSTSVHVSLHQLCSNCRMGLSPQLTSLVSLPTYFPTPFTLLASQERPGQGLQDRRPGVTCWYRVCCILSSLRPKNAPDIVSDFKCPIPPKGPVITDVSGYLHQPVCWWLVHFPALDGAPDPEMIVGTPRLCQ